ncbi:MAG: tRNA pseudouridine(55) synthase TruB [Acidimicrobiales bacterium]
MSSPDGVAVVDKARGWTSHDVVARARRLLGTPRVGHAGTLDPDATGVLVLGVGRATRLLRYVGALPKSYVGEVVLGSETTTLDAGGEVVATHQMAAVTLGQARAAAADLVGEILQVPPMVSARRVGGRRLHQLARQGVEVEREPRPVTVHRFEVTWLRQSVAGIEVECSSGTYVRVLAADLGRALGGGAHLDRLRRTAVGPFGVADADPVEELRLLPPGAAVGHLSTVAVGDDVAARVANGGRLRRRGEAVAFDGEGPWAVTSATTGTLLAVYGGTGEWVRPEVVLGGPGGGERGGDR